MNTVSKQMRKTKAEGCKIPRDPTQNKIETILGHVYDRGENKFYVKYAKYRHPQWVYAKNVIDRAELRIYKTRLALTVKVNIKK